MSTTTVSAAPTAKQQLSAMPGRTLSDNQRFLNIPQHLLLIPSKSVTGEEDSSSHIDDKKKKSSNNEHDDHQQVVKEEKRSSLSSSSSSNQPQCVEVVDPNFSWRTRRTGIIPSWTSGFGYWRHYNATELMNMNDDDDDEAPAMTPPKPFTEGWMRKSLRQSEPIDDSAFELWSVYQPQAQGGWLEGAMAERENDGNREHQYSFLQTPYRINPLPKSIVQSMNIPTGWDTTSRVIIVQPGRATFSGTLWLPSIEEQESVLSRQDPQRPFQRIQSCELWLGEPIRGRKEGRKVGCFVQYDGITGDLIQLFWMHEIAAPADDTNGPSDGTNNGVSSLLQPHQSSSSSPANPIDLSIEGPRIHATLPQTPPPLPLTSRRCGNDSCSSKTTSAIRQFLQKGRRFFCKARVIHLLDGHLKPETALQYEASPKDPIPYWTPSEDESSDPRYVCLHWEEQGVYIRVPKRFDASLPNEVSMEIGCTTCSGDLQRLLVLGHRSSGAFHTISHERWSSCPTTAAE